MFVRLDIFLTKSFLSQFSSWIGCWRVGHCPYVKIMLKTVSLILIGVFFSDQPQKKKKKSFGVVDIKKEIKSEPEDHEAGKTNI